MTLHEAAAKLLTRLRLRVWDEKTYIKLVLVRGISIGYGPWVALYNRAAQEALGFPTPQTIAPLYDDCDETGNYTPYAGYEEYTGPRDPSDVDDNVLV